VGHRPTLQPHGLRAHPTEEILDSCLRRNDKIICPVAGAGCILKNRYFMVIVPRLTPGALKTKLMDANIYSAIHLEDSVAATHKVFSIGLLMDFEPRGVILTL
jgi:hypothetical protein